MMNNLKIETPIIDFNNRIIDFILLDKIQVNTVEEYHFDFSKYKDNNQFKWIFISIENEKYRIFIENPELAVAILLNKLNENKKNFTLWEYKKITDIKKRYIKRFDLSMEVKYYFLYAELV